ncbi:ABC transporter permease [Oscillibacter sp.]|uniref:ABC transporter permease subunit n=1 Tax=Oscillibacter sp. TaxID=1945593 RepID=UPI0033974DE8
MRKIQKFFVSNAVPLLFTIICIIGVFFSGTPISTILADLVNRFDRNSLLVLSLIIPVTCGMGMNFGIVLGAMCGQLGLITVTILKMSGISAILMAALFGSLAAVLCGFLSGKILNRTKGQEMITSMIVGYFSNGIYQFIFLFAIGGIIKVNSDIILTGGVGIKNTVALDSMQYALDNLNIFGLNTRVNLFTGVFFFAAFFLVVLLISSLIHKNWTRRRLAELVICAVLMAASPIAAKVPQLLVANLLIRIPIPTFLLVILVCYLIQKFMKTKLGQDMRAVGHDRQVAAAAGINVNRVRIISVIISTVIAAWGQVIFYQNLGTMDAYYGHEKVGTFCVAAILIGGASVKKATIGQAILGTVLFHLLFTVSPLAAQHIFNNSMVGGYFRMTLCYAVIAVALMLHVWETRAKARDLQSQVSQAIR